MRRRADGPLAIAVLMGGDSSERDVSLASGAAMLAALRERGADEVRRVESLQWRREGDFRLGDDAPVNGAAALELLAAFDVCLLALHGGRGEDGTVQGWLANAGVPFTGSGVGASALALDKHASREIARASGVRPADGVLVERDESDPEARLAPLVALDAASYFVKERWGGSSIGTTRVDGARNLVAAVAIAREGGCDLVVEAGVDGVEVSCPVVTFDGAHEAWPLIEIVPRDASFFDYEQKYAQDGALERCPPELIDAQQQRRVQEMSVQIARVVGTTGVCRVDFLVPRHGERTPVFLEVNTLPGMAPRSLVPQSAARVGLDFGALCLAMARDGARRRATTGT